MSFDHHGAYGSNTWLWDTTDYWKLDVAKFKWAVVRLDTTPEVCQALASRGVKIILQAPDIFNKGMVDPGIYARNVWEKAWLRARWARYIVLDNEPNLYIDRASRWWAEQYTRWYRAVMATFRYYDSYTCHFRIIHPAFVSHEAHNFETWLAITQENQIESDAVSAHCYWEQHDLMTDLEFGGSWLRVKGQYPHKPLFITEFCPAIPGLSPQEKAQEIGLYLNFTTEDVVAVCYFILGGTKDWEKYHLSAEEAKEIGRIVT